MKPLKILLYVVGGMFLLSFVAFLACGLNKQATEPSQSFFTLPEGNSLVMPGQGTIQPDTTGLPVVTDACYSLNVPFYSQNDPSWRNMLLGYSNTWTIGNSGCYLTCVSMMYARWGYYNMNPGALNNWSYSGKAHYAFYDGTPYINPGTAASYPNMCRPVRDISVSRTAVINELAAGHPVVARVTWYGGHFVVIYGWDGSQFWVKDPVRDWTAQNQPLSGNLSGVTYLKVFGN